MREGWLNQLVQPLGLDAFFEAALKRSIGEPAGFVGDLTTARTGFFFKRDQAPLLRRLAMRGSIEAETNLQHRLHLTTALGFEKPTQRHHDRAAGEPDPGGRRARACPTTRS